MRALVAGGTGFIGRCLCRDLAARGHDVTILSRREEPASEGFERITWDSNWASRLERTDAVVNLAGEGIADRMWTARRKEVLRTSRIQTTRKMVSALSSLKRPPAVLVNASAVGYYGDRGEEILTEKSAAGEGFLAQLCREWESEALKARSYGVRAVCLRLGIVLGKDGGALPRMALPFRLFLGGPLGSGRQFMSWIHVEDAAGLILWAMEQTQMEGILNATAPQPATNTEFSLTLASVLKRPCLFRAPAVLLNLALGERSGLLLEGQRALPERAIQAGYTFRYPDLEQALKDCLL